MADDKLRIVATVEDQFTGPLGKLKGELKGVGDETRRQAGGWKGDWDGVRASAEKYRGVLGDFSPVLSKIGVGGLGAALSLGGVAVALEKFAGSTRGLSLMAKDIGLTVNQLRTFNALGEQFGVTAGTMQGAAKTFSDEMKNIQQHGSDYVQLQAMNLGKLAEDLASSKNMEEAIERGLDGLKNIPDPVIRRRVSRLLFGTDDIGLISSNLTGTAKAALQEVQSRIGEIDKATEEASKRFEGSLNRAINAFERLKVMALSPVLGGAATVMDGIADTIDTDPSDPKSRLKYLKKERQDLDAQLKALPDGSWKRGYIENRRNGLDEEIGAIERPAKAPKALDEKLDAQMRGQAVPSRAERERSAQISDVEARLADARRRHDWNEKNVDPSEPKLAPRQRELAEEIRRLTDELRRLREQGGATVSPSSYSGPGAGGGSLIQKAAWGGGFGGSSGNNAGIPSYGSPGGSGGGSNSPSAPVPHAAAIQRGGGALTPNAGPLGATPEAQSPGAYFGQDVDVSRLPAGMRNNNPGNLKYSGSDWQKRNFPGMVGPSQNTDQGSPQIVFNSPEAGMRAAARLALGKFDGGADTLQKIIAGQNGWTPGHPTAPANIAKTMGIGPNDKLDLHDPVQMQKFLRGLLWQEQGPSNLLYKDETLQRAAEAALGRTGFAGGSGPLTRSGDDVPSVDGIGGVDQRQGAGIRRQAITDELRDQLAKAAREAGVNTEIYSGGQDAHGSHRTGSHRHDGGRSADVRLYTTGPNGERRYLSMNDPSDRKVMESFIRGTVRHGATGVGAGPGYMGEHGIHIGGGEPSAWGAGGRSANAPDWVRRAHRQGLADHEAALRGAAKAEAAPSQNERVGDALIDRFYGKGAANAGPAMQMPGGSGGISKGKLDIHLHGFPSGTQSRASMDDLFKETNVSNGRRQMDMERI